MNRSERDATRVVRSWLDEGADRIPDRVLDTVEAQLPATRQRQASRLARTWALLRRRSVGYGIAAAAVIVGAAAFGALGYLPSNIGAQPSKAPTPEPNVLPLEVGEIPPGSYTLEGFPTGIVFDLPAGFGSCSDSPVERAICSLEEGNLAPALGFLVLENVVEEPCSDVLRDPPPDSVEEMVAAISSLDGFEATSAVDVSIDGFSGKRLVVTAPTRISCDRLTWATAERINGVGLGEVNELTIVDVDGVLVMFSLAHFPTDPPRESLGMLRQVVESIRISR